MRDFRFLLSQRRTGRLFFLLVMAVAVLLPTACAKGETGRFFSDPAQPIQTQAGQAFVITLPSLQAATHEWQLAQEIDPALLQLTAAKQTETHYVNTPADERNQEYWIFMPSAPGNTTIALDYISPSGEVAEERVFEVEILR